MNRHERGLEFKVGAFVFVGLAMLGALIVQFGRLGEGFKTYYGLTVRFSDASGLLKGSDVLLAEARVWMYRSRFMITLRFLKGANSRSEVPVYWAIAS